jgi:very-short-patch-repair endonuclease
VEVDGYVYHVSRQAFERDRQRDAALVAAGHRVIRFTWRQLTAGSEAVLVRLTQALSATGGR